MPRKSELMVAAWPGPWELQLLGENKQLMSLVTFKTAPRLGSTGYPNHLTNSP